MKRSIRPLLPALALLCLSHAAVGRTTDATEEERPAIHIDNARKTVQMENGRLGLRISLNGGCRIDSLWIGSKSVVGSGEGAYSGVRVGPHWYTTRSLPADPRVVSGPDSVRISGIRYPVGDIAVDESWTFAFDGGSLLWTIDRVLPQAMNLDGNAFPAFGFTGISVFDAALLGNGGVAWFRLFNDTPLAYGVHTDFLTFWRTGDERCLEIGSRADGAFPAVTLSRVDTSLTCAFSLSPSDLSYRYDSTTHRRRLVRGTTDVWQTALYPAGAYRQVLRISSPAFQDELGRGTFRGIDGEAVTSILNTIARLGVIDSRHYGGNSWHTPYGPICLHEQYIGQFNVAIDDANYAAGYAKCLDYYRDHAILPEGRVKSRWAYTDEDAMPGTADTLGFYEAQWGILLDSNPDFVINVADEFDQNGDIAWLRTHKQSCERVLGFMLGRDTDRDSLVEMMTDSHREKKGSDWLDVIWASGENAFVNAELYHALDRWSDLEDVMGDPGKARDYRDFAAGLKRSFNRSTAEGGFWQDSSGWYVHWREKDGTVWGNNLVTPVNFMAIAYGLCDAPARRALILDAIQLQMQKERLFFWPVCMFPYEAGAAHDLNYPFPAYENGDLFLSWGELGVRAYAADFPEIALRFVRNVIERYRKDGLAFQRYLRATQEGAGDDILAGNASAITGLYRDIYGIQPLYNRLYLNPHLVNDLYGTRIRYRLRGVEYAIDLNAGVNSVAVGGFKVSSPGDFAIGVGRERFLWYAGNSDKAALVLSGAGMNRVQVTIREWSEKRRWAEKNPSSTNVVSHEIMDLPGDQEYEIYCNGRKIGTTQPNVEGILRFSCGGDSQGYQLFEVIPR
jgi:hypothetical protein